MYRLFNLFRVPLDFVPSEGQNRTMREKFSVMFHRKKLKKIIYIGIYCIHFACYNLYAFSLTESVIVCILFIPSNRQRWSFILLIKNERMITHF